MCNNTEYRLVHHLEALKEFISFLFLKLCENKLHNNFVSGGFPDSSKCNVMKNSFIHAELKNYFNQTFPNVMIHLNW